MTPMNRRQWQRTMAKWDTFENVLGTRDTLWEDIEEFGTLTLSDACLHKRLINDVPSLAEMLEKEAEINKRTKGGGNSVDSCSIGPGALCDYGSYQKRSKLQIVPVAGAPVLSIGANIEGGTIRYLATASGTRDHPLSNNGNHWSPVFLVGAKKGESPGWCGVLNVGVDNLQELEENWVDKCAEVGQPGGAREEFVNVDQDRHESEISANASMGARKTIRL